MILDGTLIELDEAWEIFNGDYKPDKMLSTLTQMEHPLLFKPFFMLHPCNTEKFLSNFDESTNKVITFLSTVGPNISLTMDLKYGIKI